MGVTYKMEKCQVIFRTAALQDMEAVMGISEGVYAGMDYLPAKYEDWIREEHEEGKRRNFVIESKVTQDVVGYFSILFNHKKTRYILCASRVGTQYRGNGIFKQAQLYVKCLIEKDYCNAKQMIVFVNYWLSDEDTERKIQREGRLLQTLGLKVFCVKIEKIGLNIKKGQLKLGLVEKKCLHSYLRENTLQKMFPFDYLYIDFQPYDICEKEDIDYVLDSLVECVVKGENSFSIQCKKIEVEAGTKISVDIFATTVEEFLEHLRFQLSIVKTSLSKKSEFFLFLHHNPTFYDGVITMMQHELGVTENEIFSGGKAGLTRPMASVY